MSSPNRTDVFRTALQCVVTDRICMHDDGRTGIRGPGRTPETAFAYCVVVHSKAFSFLEGHRNERAVLPGDFPIGAPAEDVELSLPVEDEERSMPHHSSSAESKESSKPRQPQAQSSAAANNKAQVNKLDEVIAEQLTAAMNEMALQQKAAPEGRLLVAGDK